jgi:hypothetical protein
VIADFEAGLAASRTADRSDGQHQGKNEGWFQ